MVIEMRTYKTKPGMRAAFLDTFSRKTIPAHQAIGMKVLGPFLSVEDPDVFFWMRGFPDLGTRETMRDRFYGSALWKDDLEHTLFPLLEKFDVVLVQADGAERGLGAWR